MERAQGSRFGLISSLVIVLNLVLLLMLPGARAAGVGAGAENPRMATSTSPYLRLHARDLVRWYAWGEEAFALARRANLPIMVSFGYTACHWCHVMQKTHFNNPAIATAINEKFIPVLVDRERRTALDDTYMLVTEALTKRGGWPNTVFMTPAREPFYGTAYIPAKIFTQLLQAIEMDWRKNREAVVAEGRRLATLLNGYLTRKVDAQELSPQVLAKAAKGLAAQFDPLSGGIGQAPKFFRAPILMLLLQHAERTGDKEALGAVERTLQAVLSGGIHDHLEGGFHRYAIDPGWRIPHFEKMLYDQAQMAEVFTTAFQITGRPEYAATVRKTLDYVLADFEAPEGGFYSTRDADSEGAEGTYYVWTESQLRKVLGAADGKFASTTFGTVADGEFAGKIILNKDQVRNQSVPRLDRIFRKLGAARKARPRPQRDDKILAAWNGATIASLAAAAIVLGDARYAMAAKKAGAFIWANMRTPDGRLQRSHYDGVSSVEGELDDYGQLARGYIFLFDLTGARHWLDKAAALAGIMAADFEDKEAGDFFATRRADGFGRIKPRSDIDQPSGNGSALDLLARLARRSVDPEYQRKVEKALSALSGIALKEPAGGASILAAADRHLRGETGSLQYAGKGVVRVAATPSADFSQVILRFKIADGWHVNGDKPLEPHLIPTKLVLEVDGKSVAAEIGYPTPVIKKLAFSEKPMALLENEFEITARLNGTRSPTVSGVLEVQVCSNEICLLPETLKLRVALTDNARP